MGNCESDVLGPSYGGLVGRSLKAYRSVHQRGPGWVMSESWVCAGLIGRQPAQRFRNQGCWLILTETPVPKDKICC